MFTVMEILQYHKISQWYFIKCTEESLLLDKYVYVYNKKLSETQFYKYRNQYILLF
jgi:hypothetical protein